jgi:hypothetical protein
VCVIECTIDATELGPGDSVGLPFSVWIDGVCRLISGEVEGGP